jgi:hypothetical protein
MIIPSDVTGSELLKQADFQTAARIAAALLGMKYMQSMQQTGDEAREQGQREQEYERQEESDRMRQTIEAMHPKTASAKGYAQASGALMAKHAFGAALAKGLWSGAKDVGGFVGGATGVTKTKLLGGLALAGGGMAIHKATKAGIGQLESPQHSTQNWGGSQPMKTNVNEYGVASY